MTREIVSASGAPSAVGPYSQAVRAGGFVFCSGQIPLDPATGELRAGSIEEATERCILNLQEVLRAAGSELADAVQVTVYVTDMSLFSRLNAVYERFFPADPPSRACVEVSGLPKGAPVEIALVARERG
ncbi:MAG: Rid family detoxifying hydrolase [Planctomycetota bacterium]|jgi:2-iminobutanoate/2-iminopropanoate deaminase